MPWYSQGQVAVTANSDTVTGTGTAFSANARVGDAFRGPDGRWYEITNIASATVLSIRPNYQGTTASGQAYTIAPMQGYVKESADRLRQLVDQYGSQLAALQPWATSATPAAAREALGANDAANLTAGLISAARVPATLTPDKAFRRGNILGTVSQVGGIPTGAIIERGSNANGEYVRFADGTQICWGSRSIAFGSDTQVFTSYDTGLPAAFVGASPGVGHHASVNIAYPTVTEEGFTVLRLTGTTLDNLTLRIQGVVTPAQICVGSFLVVGRWY